jgi:hypothetical protein
MNTNPFPGYPKGEMMDTKTNMNTNPSSGYPKEDMMDNITKMNTSPLSNVVLFSNLLRNHCIGGSLSVHIIMKTSSKVEHFWDLMASSVRMSLYCPPFQFEDTLSLGILKGK